MPIHPALTEPEVVNRLLWKTLLPLSRARLAFPLAHASILPISTARVPQVACLAEVRCVDVFREGNMQRNL
jgi:hypothetical protein